MCTIRDRSGLAVGREGNSEVDGSTRLGKQSLTIPIHTNGVDSWRSDEGKSGARRSDSRICLDGIRNWHNSLLRDREHETRKLGDSTNLLL